LIESNCEIVFVAEAGRLSIIQKLRNYPNSFWEEPIIRAGLKSQLRNFLLGLDASLPFLCA
jgi:hypothetical protein